MPTSRSIYHFSAIDKEDSFEVGVSGVSLGTLAHAGLPLPEGFILSSSVYFSFLTSHHLTTKISHLLQTVNFADSHSLLQVSSHIKKLILTTEMADETIEDITKAYRKLSSPHTETACILEPSVTSHALPTPSLFTYRADTLPIQGERSLLVGIKEIWASLFDARSLYYRHEEGVDQFHVGMAVIVTKHYTPLVSGTFSSQNIRDSDKHTYVVTAQYGLSAQQEAQDRYEISKVSKKIVHQDIAEQRLKHLYHAGKRTSNPVPGIDRSKPKISQQELGMLLSLAGKLEKTYYFPFSFSWIVDQSQLIVLSVKPLSFTETPSQQPNKKHRIHSGRLVFLSSGKDLGRIREGDIVFVTSVEETLIPYLKSAGGLLTAQKELSASLRHRLQTQGIPFLTGIEPQTLTDGVIVTLDTKTGSLATGGYRMAKEGALSTMHSKPADTATKVYFSITSPSQFQRAKTLTSDGIGIFSSLSILEEIGVHPKEYASQNKLETLAEKVIAKTLALAHHYDQDPFVYKLLDASCHHLKKLSNGTVHEVAEPNHLLGFRGAYRLLHDKALLGFELQILSGLHRELHSRLHILLPFIRSVSELSQLQDILKAAKLVQPTAKLWLSVETPATLIELDEYLGEGLGGVVLDMTTLTSLFTGVDGMNSEVSSLLSEERSALLQAYRFALKVCHKANVPVFAASPTIAHKEQLLATFLNWGISGLIIPPQHIENLRKTIYKYERKLVQ